MGGGERRQSPGHRGRAHVGGGRRCRPAGCCCVLVTGSKVFDESGLGGVLEVTAGEEGDSQGQEWGFLAGGAAGMWLPRRRDDWA